MRKTVLSLLVICAFGVSHAQPNGVAGQHQNRAASLMLNQNYEAAIEELKQAADYYKTAESWPYYFSCLNQITQAQIELGQLDAAKQSAKQALWQSIETLSRDNDEAAKASHKLGQVYEAAGRYEDAMECHRMAYDIRENLFSERHPQVAASHIFMAVTARKQRDFEQSSAFLEQAEAILTQYYEAGHPEVASVLEERGMLLELQGETVQAKENFKRAIDILKAFPNQYPEALGRIWCRLARLLPEGQRAEAYQRAYHLFEANERMQTAFAAEAAMELAQDALQAGQPALTVQMAGRAMQHPDVRLIAVQLLAKSHLLMGQFGPAFIHYQDWIGATPNELLPEDWVNAVETALLNKHAKTALLWSRMYADRTEGLLPRYYVACSYALLGNTTRAQQILNKILRSEEPKIIKALAEERLGQLDFEQGDIESALEHFEAALAMAGAPHYCQIRLLAVMGKAHTLLAAQDRHTVDNINAAQTCFQKLEAHLTQLMTNPLTPFEMAWLDRHLEEVVNSGVQHLYLQQQYASLEFSIEGAYQWFESAKIALLQFHSQQKNTAPAFWKYRAYRLKKEFPYGIDGSKASSAVAEAWGRFRSEQAKQLRYQLNTALSWTAFQELMSDLELGSYHYWIADEYLYVLQLHADAGRLYRTSWSLAGTGSLKDAPGQLTMQSLFPDVEAFNDAQVKGLALFPVQQLSMYPFGQIRSEDLSLGKTFPVYRHLCATSFAADRASAHQLPDTKAPGYVLNKAIKKVEESTPVAMPTSNAAASNCTSFLRSWFHAQEDLEMVANPEKGISGRVLFCADPSSAIALSEDVSAMLRTRYVVFDEAYADYFGNSTKGLLNRVRAQQYFKGTFIEQQNLCSDPDVHTKWLEVLSSGEALKQKLASMKGQPGQEVLSTVRTFGAPYDLLPSPGPGEIPIFWILGGVFGLILTGLWVRR